MRKLNNKLPEHKVTRWAFAMAIIIVFASAPIASAQTTVSGNPCAGQNGFVIKDSAGRTVSRGWTSPNGTLGDGVVLGANQTFTITVANGRSGTIGRETFTTGNNGSTLTLPMIQVGTSIDRDSDGDGITDEIEDVFGTDPHNPSTFGNGIRDSEIVNTPPPPGSPGGITPTIPINSAFGPPGVISSVTIPGICVDICAFNDTVALACQDQGVVVFNVFNGLSPRQIASVATPGNARAVGCPGDDLPVADGPSGLSIVDLRNPAAAKIRAQVILGSFAESVASVGGIAYVGLRNGQLVVVDLSSATEVQRLNLGAEVYDVAIAGDYVWTISGNDLRAFSSADGILSQAGKLTVSQIGPDPLSGRKRLFVGGGWAQVACMSGFDNVDVRNPAAMIRVGSAPTSGGPGSFKQIISNGSGLGTACVGINPRADGSHNVYLYDLSVPATTTALLTILKMPGTAYANVLYNGLDYVADGVAGLQVLRYLETDRKGIPPTITLDSSAIGGQAEEGKLFRITANAQDDVQVRNVEFYVDGNKIATDGNFPFEIFFNTPQLTPAKKTFTIRARAFDTGGNSTWSDPLTIGLGPDITPPRVAKTLPLPNTIVGGLNTVIAFFSEPLRPDSVVPSAFTIVSAGPDGILGTADDQPAPPGTLTYQDSLKAAVWTFPAPLPRGLWRATVSGPISDRTGNVISMPYAWIFHLFEEPDRDHDGVPDALEVLLGLDPDNPDSKGDGIRDGDRDFDNDGLSNAWEFYWGLDPRNPHSLDPILLDGDVDMDGDALINRLEQAAGTNPRLADTDGDGWNDEAEFTAGSDPLDPNSRPSMLVVAAPYLSIGLPRALPPGQGGGLTLAQPPVIIGLPAATGDLLSGIVVSQPPVIIGLPTATGDLSGGITVGYPTLTIGLSAANGDINSGLTVANPPLKTQFLNQ